MNILYDTAGATYTIMRVYAPPGTAVSYEMRPEFNGVPDAFVHYHSGRLHRFCPGGQPCNPQGFGLPTDPYNKVGTYNFIVSEESVWDCISPKGAYPHRVVLETLTTDGTVGGDVYVAAGTWSFAGQEPVTAPLLITGIPEGIEVVCLTDDGLLFHHIHTEPLDEVTSLD